MECIIRLTDIFDMEIPINSAPILLLNELLSNGGLLVDMANHQRPLGKNFEQKEYSAT